MKKKLFRLILSAGLCLAVALSLTGCNETVVDEAMVATYEDMRVTLTEQGIFAPEEGKLPFAPVTWEVTWADETAKDKAVGYLVTGTEAFDYDDIVYTLAVGIPTEEETAVWDYECVVWSPMDAGEDNIAGAVTFYRDGYKYQFSSTYPYKESNGGEVRDHTQEKLMNGAYEMLRQEGAQDPGYIEVPLDTTWWQDSINNKSYGPVAVVRGDKMYRLMGSEFSQIVHNNVDPDKVLSNRAYWFSSDGTVPAERPNPVPLPEGATTQGTTETYICNDFDHTLELQISNVREIRKETAYEQTYDVYVVYPGAMAAVINADMTDAVSYHEGEHRFLVPDWSFYTHIGYRFGIYDGMEPIPITEELCGVIDEGYVPLQFEMYTGDETEDKGTTEYDIAAMFSAVKKEDWDYIDDVLIADQAYGRVGAVLYRDNDLQITMVAFFDANGNYQTAGAYANTADDPDLTYLGDGTVRFKLIDPNGKEILYRLTFAVESDNVIYTTKDEVLP